MSHMKYGWKYYLAPTPRNVAKWMLIVEGVLATVAASEFITGNEKAAFYILLATGLLNKLANFFGEEPNDNERPQ